MVWQRVRVRFGLSVPDFAEPQRLLEVARTAVREIGERRQPGGRFDVAVWAVAPDAARRREYEEAGATWLIDDPAPGPDWLDDALAIASTGPPERERR